MMQYFKVSEYARHLRGLCFANYSDIQLFLALFCGNRVDVADQHMKQCSLVSENRWALQFPFNLWSDFNI